MTTWSLIAVNRSAAEQTVKISTAMFDCEMDSYLFSEDTLPTDGSQIAASGKVSSEGGAYSIKIPAYSFSVLKSAEPASVDSETADSTAEQLTEGESTSEQVTEPGGCKSTAAPFAALALATAAAAVLGKKKD